jgi:polyisoprenoid-binding protein YceI
MRRLATFVAVAFTAYSPFAAALDNTAPPPVPAGAYQIDKLHASLLFRVNHIGFSKYTARFTNFDAKLDFDPNRLESARVSATVDARSVAADNVPSSFLEMLGSKEWLDAESFPEMTFRSKSIEVTSPNSFRINGDLTLHGVTKPIVLEARYNGGYASHPYEPRARIGFSAHGKFNRSDFGVTIGIPAAGTTMGVSDEVEVILESEFTGPPK